MKKIGLLLTAIGLVLLATAQQNVVVDPNASVRNLQGIFNAIQVSDGIDLYLSQSDQAAVAVSAADERSKSDIKTELKNSTLFIKYDGDRGWIKKNKKLKVYVSFKELTGINASGSSDVFVLGKLTTTNLDIHMSGACDFKGAVYANKLNLKLSGASDVHISGSVNILDIESSGASDVKSFDLVANYCKANVSGASDVQITVNKELTAQATGASDIRYKGNALLKEKQNSGASSIRKVN